RTCAKLASAHRNEPPPTCCSMAAVLPSSLLCLISRFGTVSACQIAGPYRVEKIGADPALRILPDHPEPAGVAFGRGPGGAVRQPRHDLTAGIRRGAHSDDARRRHLTITQRYGIRRRHTDHDFIICS